MQETGAPAQRANGGGGVHDHQPRAGAACRTTAPMAAAPDAPATLASPKRTSRRGRPWALINHTRRQHVDIGPDGVHFERDPIRYMRTVLSLAWSASDDMVMLPARHMLPAGHAPEAYTEALVWPVPSDDAASSSSSSQSDSDWDDDDAYSSDYDSDSFDSDDQRDEQPIGAAARDGAAIKDTAGALAPTAAPRRNR
ncbi:hypothetical protein psal_cds_398 [Pandoravirus salinus]|uniref:Uncharacterized protein n=1 Tax=Pandoravirus salinus TaxID=1349410 RepID=S4W1S8_9VIRU|nr:hypothetical protein psal_cds_398 [Pandoravirus salinus]AGO84095.1 hypothetical protein psal_cds_398 [Pandoravirus salinus]